MFNFDGTMLSLLEPHTNFMQVVHRSPAIAATAFHPHSMLLGCATKGDSHVTLFGCGKERIDRPMS